MRNIVNVLLLSAVIGVCFCTAVAQTRQEAILWDSISNSKNAADYRGYLDQYPNGTWAAVAKRRLEQLDPKSDVRTFELKHLAGQAMFSELAGKFPHFGDGVLTVSSRGVAWSEAKKAGHDFELTPCSKLQFTQEKPYKNSGIYEQLKVVVAGKTYTFEWKPGVYEALKEACPRE